MWGWGAKRGGYILLFLTHGACTANKNHAFTLTPTLTTCCVLLRCSLPPPLYTYILSTLKCDLSRSAVRGRAGAVDLEYSACRAYPYRHTHTRISLSFALPMALPFESADRQCPPRPGLHPHITALRVKCVCIRSKKRPRRGGGADNAISHMCQVPRVTSGRLVGTRPPNHPPHTLAADVMNHLRGV